MRILVVEDLTIWNTAILSVILAGFSFALCSVVQANQLAAIDRSLEERARGFGGGPARDILLRIPGSPAPHMPFPPDELRPPEGEHPANELLPRFPAAPPGPPGLGRAPAVWDMALDRPRVFSLEGRPPPVHADDVPWDPPGFAAAVRGQAAYGTVQVEGERLRVLSTPVLRRGEPVGVVQVAQPLSEQQRLLESQVRTIVVLLPVALLVAVLGGMFLTRRVLRPVGEVTRAAAEIGAEDLSRRLKVHGKDEFAQLALTLNGMISRLERAFDEQRRFTGDASHELRTPLTRIKGSTSRALQGPRDLERYREALETADRSADAMSRIVQDLLFLARADAGRLALEREPVPVEALLQDAAAVAAGEGEARVKVEYPAAPLEVLGDAEPLSRLLTNLLNNALRHTPPDGEVRLSARREEDQVVFTVADTGEGIAPEHLPFLFERFYRVDKARTAASGGTGLGLSICRSIVQAHGGTIGIESEPGRGTVVTVRLPAAPS